MGGAKQNQQETIDCGYDQPRTITLFGVFEHFWLNYCKNIFQYFFGCCFCISLGPAPVFCLFRAQKAPWILSFTCLFLGDLPLNNVLLKKGNTWLSGLKPLRNPNVPTLCSVSVTKGNSNSGQMLRLDLAADPESAGPLRLSLLKKKNKNTVWN